MANQFTREGNAVGGTAIQVALTQVHQKLLVSAVINYPVQTLDVTVWQVTGDQSGTVAGAAFISKRSETTAGKCSEISLASTGEIHQGWATIIAALRDDSGKLKLICWRINQDGSVIERLGDASGGAIFKVKIIQVSPGRMATAVTRNKKDLKLIIWGIQEHGKRIVREAEQVADSDYEQGYWVSLAKVKEQSNVVTLVSGTVPADDMEFPHLNVWKIQPSESGHVTLTLVSNAIYPGQLPTAFTSQSSWLDVVKFGVSLDTDLVEHDIIGIVLRSGISYWTQPHYGHASDWHMVIAHPIEGTESVFHSIFEHYLDKPNGRITAQASTIVGAPFGSDSLISASQVALDPDHLRLSAFKYKYVAETKEAIAIREGYLDTDEHIYGVAIHRMWANHFVTAVIDPNGYLKLIGWRHNGKA